MRSRAGRWITFSLLCCLWLVAAAAHADVRQARDPIFDRRTANLLATVQAGGTDLPMSLRTGRDVYLFVTAGAVYTDVRVLALPSVPPPRLAQALASGAAGTPLASATATWSADDYSAAEVQAGHGHLLARRARNTVPVGALIAGMRRAGFVPHTLLRVPIYATAAGMPPPCQPPTYYAWYDDAQTAHLSQVSVRAALTPADVALALFFLFFVGTVGVVGLLVGSGFARDTRLPLDVRRRRYKAWTTTPVLAAIAVHAPVMIFYLRTKHPMAVADLWLGSPTTSVMVPLIVLGPLAMVFLLPNALRVEKKLLGAAPAVAPVPMSSEEMAVRARMARWTFVPHLAAMVGLFFGIFLLPRTSPYYQTLHPMLTILPALGGVIAALLFRKPLAAFTRITHDDDLTWRARQLGMQMGVRPENVKVEDSSRAAHYATIATQRGGDILVSRKLLEVMSREETEFLLAHQVALQKVKGRLSTTTLLTFLPALAPIVFFVWLWMQPGSSALRFFNLMPYVLSLMFLSLVIPLFFKRQLLTATARRAVEADQAALAVTSDVATAQSALTKLLQNAPALAGQAATTSAAALALTVRIKALGLPTAGARSGTGRA